MGEFTKIIIIMSMSFCLISTGYILIECANYELTLEKTKGIEFFSCICSTVSSAKSDAVYFVKNISINGHTLSDMYEFVKSALNILYTKITVNDFFYTF